MAVRAHDCEIRQCRTPDARGQRERVMALREIAAERAVRRLEVEPRCLTRKPTRVAENGELLLPAEFPLAAVMPDEEEATPRPSTRLRPPRRAE